MTVTVEQQVRGVTTGSSGLVVRTAVHRDRTELDVACPEGIRTARIAAVPDDAAARAADAAMRHVLSVRFDIDAGAIGCTLRGIGHRTPREVPIALTAGLGLVRRGLVALVVWREDA